MALTKAKLIADGVIDVDNLAAGHSITTSNIGEGSNLYYTDGRVASYLTTNSYATESFVTTGYLPLSGGNITGNFTVDTNTLYVDATNNRVGIGTSSPEGRLRLSGDGTSSGGLVLDNGAQRGYIYQNGATMYTTIGSSVKTFVWGQEGGSELMRILPTGGITFNGDTAAANALDDYEEGTWSPYYRPSSGSYATITMDVLSATYTKIGRQVTVIAYFRTDNVDISGASGYITLDGLPFTNASLGWSAVSLANVRLFSVEPAAGYVGSNETRVRFQKLDATVGMTDSPNQDLTTGVESNHNQMMITATYFTA